MCKCAFKCRDTHIATALGNNAVNVIHILLIKHVFCTSNPIRGDQDDTFYDQSCLIHGLKIVHTEKHAARMLVDGIDECEMMGQRVQQLTTTHSTCPSAKCC